MLLNKSLLHTLLACLLAVLGTELQAGEHQKLSMTQLLKSVHYISLECLAVSDNFVMLRLRSHKVAHSCDVGIALHTKLTHGMKLFVVSISVCNAVRTIQRARRCVSYTFVLVFHLGYIFKDT